MWEPWRRCDILPYVRVYVRVLASSSSSSSSCHEGNVRLFDRGDVNSYSDNLRFLRIICRCCHGARLPATLDHAQLSRLEATYQSLLLDVSQLIATVRSYPLDAMLRPASQTPVALSDNVDKTIRGRAVDTTSAYQQQQQLQHQPSWWWWWWYADDSLQYVRTGSLLALAASVWRRLVIESTG